MLHHTCIIHMGVIRNHCHVHSDRPPINLARSPCLNRCMRAGHQNSTPGCVLIRPALNSASPPLARPGSHHRGPGLHCGHAVLGGGATTIQEASRQDPGRGHAARSSRIGAAPTCPGLPSFLLQPPQPMTNSSVVCFSMSVESHVTHTCCTGCSS